MFINDPTSARILHSARLIEARQARPIHKPVKREPRQPSLARQLLSLTMRSRRRAGAFTGPLNESHELFDGHDHRQLTRLGRYFTVVDMDAGATLGRQGDIAREFVTILHGEVGVTINGIPHAVLDDGSHFGAVPLLADTPGAPHTASFTVMTPTCVAVANPAEFRSMLFNFPLIDQRVRAMTDVRRAYLAGLAHVNAEEQPISFDPASDGYPVHAAIQQVPHR